MAMSTDEADEAYTVSKMLSSINAVMAPVAQDPSVSVALKRKMDNGVMLDTSAKEIAFLDMQAKVKHSAQKVAKLERADKAKWVDAQRQRGNDAFKRCEYAEAADCYMQALAALDFGTTAAEKEHCQLTAQLPLTCNLAACMMMLEQWEKARRMSDEALKINPKYVKALQQRARASTKLNDHEAARNDVRSAIAVVTSAPDEPTIVSTTPQCDDDTLARLEKQLLDIDRAEKRHKQQLLQQKEFQKKMMREAVGRLYQDKKEVAPLRGAFAAAQIQEPNELSWTTRLLRRTRLALANVLQLAARVVAGFFSRLLRHQTPRKVKKA